VLLGTALLAQVEGQGHACLPLDALLQDAQGLLAWGPEPLAQLGHVLDRLPGSVPGWRAALCRSPLVAHGRPAPGSAQPLVLAGQRLYLRRYWHFEQEVAQQVRQRVATAESVGLVRGAHLAGPPVSAAPAAGPAATDWQKPPAPWHCAARLSVITGGPGTGKTYTAARLLALLLAMAPAPERLRVALAAPTGKAAARLRQSIDEALQGLQAAWAAGLALRAAALLPHWARRAPCMPAGRPARHAAFRHHAGAPARRWTC
jgi:exodeoxyribonuclease V alpha subunit